MSISVKGLTITDGTRTLEFPEGHESWAVDACARLVRADFDTIQAALDATGFRPDQEPTGPQVDNRIKRTAQLRQHNAQTDIPPSGSTRRKLDGVMLRLTTEGPAAGIAESTIATWTARADVAFDQAGFSSIIGNVLPLLARYGIVDDNDDTDTSTGTADAPVKPTADVKAIESKWNAS